MTKSLLVGLGLVAASISYMVGASHTPVMNVAVPVVFGLVVMTFGLLQRQGQRSELQARLTPDESARGQMPPETVTMLTALAEELRAAPRRVGVALIVCSLCYMAAAIGGSVVSRPGQSGPRPFPWPAGDPPQNATTALEWISLQEGLLSLGFSGEQVLQVYALDRPASPGQTKEDSEATPSPVALETVKTTLPDEPSGDMTLQDRLKIILGDRVEVSRSER
ncbi:MAG: hypothetical protein CL477_18890 [Acidobacteria bacterium]|jgi:hypothetical protein|nr:hypothetical protein [Acidobacteriota bacterium]HJN46729.1 hypothetical protein [Vicinamibacterales bacterium]